MRREAPKDFDFIAAIAAFRQLRAKGDPESGARLTLALGMRKWYRLLTEKVRQQAGGEQLLATKPSMGELLNDWPGLRALPDGSLGREYLRWAEREQLTVKGLEEAVAPVFETLPTEEQEYIRNRSRDLHDLFHVLTGYGRDSGGETALLVFTAIQHENKALRILSWLGLIHAFFKRRFDIIRLRSQAKKRARLAPILIAQPWQDLLARPIDAVRCDMNLQPIPSYQRFDVR